MHQDHRLQLANRIHQELMRELGQGIDLKQMLHSALYARDVLLVCRAYPGSELQRLGLQFVLASAEAERQALRPSGWRRDSSGFALSMPPLSGAPSDFDSDFNGPLHLRRAPRRWLAPSTWFVR